MKKSELRQLIREQIKESYVNEGFTKDDWDVKWKLPKDNLFNASKTIDAVNNRSNAIQDLLKLNPKALQAFNNDDEHPAIKMSYNELMRWYYPIMKESVNEAKKPAIVVYNGKRLAVDPRDIERLKSGKDIVGKSTKHTGQEEWISAKGKWKVEESVNEGLPPGYAKFLVSLQTLIGDIAPNAWGNKSQITSSSVKRVHNSLKKRYGTDYKKFNDLLKTQKGQFGNWYLNVPVNEGITRADFYKQIEKEAFTAGWDSYEENANVEDAFNRFSSQQDAAQEEPKSYAKGGGSDFIDPMGLRESVNEVADPSALELVGALSTIIGGSLGIKFGMDLLNKIVDKALAVTKYTATEILKIVKDNTAPLKAAAQEGKRAFIKKLMSLIINPTTTTSDYLDRIPKDPPFTIKRNEGTCGYDTDARTGKRFKTPGGL